jgi:hypothetical protein
MENQRLTTRPGAWLRLPVELPEPERWRLPGAGASFGVLTPALGSTPALASIRFVGHVGRGRYVCHATLFYPDGTTERVGAIPLLNPDEEAWDKERGYIRLTEGGL